MKHSLYFWVERYLFNPTLPQKILSFFLLPLTLVYCAVIYLKRIFYKPIDFNIPIISIGNIIVGGSGKTPLTIELAKEKKSIAIILRGHGRETKGLVVVSKNGKIVINVSQSGDEAMMIAKSLPNATVIVSEDRIKAIIKAKELGSKIIFLDDGYSKKMIKKFDILIKPDLNNINNFCLPSGPYRELKSEYDRCDLLIKEGIDFKRVVEIKNKTSKMILVTAISKPERLDRYIDENIERFYFPDHYNFKKEELDRLMKKCGATSILTTQKDSVKLERFDLTLSIIDLKLDIDEKIFKKIESFLEVFDKI